jgi:hypothetical protein
MSCIKYNSTVNVYFIQINLGSINQRTFEITQPQKMWSIPGKKIKILEEDKLRILRIIRIFTLLI